MKFSPAPARGMACSFARGRTRARHHRVEIKRELAKIGLRVRPAGRGTSAGTARVGADFSFPLQFRCPFCLLGSFNFRFSSFCFVSAERRAQIHLETVADLESGSSPSPTPLKAAKKVSLDGGKAEPKPTVGENEPGYGTHGKNRPTCGWQRGCLPERPGEGRGRRAPFLPGQIGLLK